MEDKKSYNFLLPYLTDKWAELHPGYPDIVLDVAEITKVEFIDIFEPDPDRLAFLEKMCGHKINVNEEGGYNIITVECPNPEHGRQHYFIPSGEDPTTQTLHCRLCRRERMEEIDRQRERRKYEYEHPAKTEEEKQNPKGRR